MKSVQLARALALSPGMMRLKAGQPAARFFTNPTTVINRQLNVSSKILYGSSISQAASSSSLSSRGFSTFSARLKKVAPPSEEDFESASKEDYIKNLKSQGINNKTTKSSKSSNSGPGKRTPVPTSVYAKVTAATLAGFAIGFFGFLLWPNYIAPSITKLDKTQSPKYGETEFAIQAILKVLKPEQVVRSKSVLDDHSDTYYSTHHPSDDQRPLCVVYPENTDEVSKIMKICYEYNVPVVPFSGGTSLEGHFIPTRGGITIDLGRMNQVIQLNKDDLDIVVQPALGWEELRDYLADYDLMFGPDPGPGACIGGMVATSCSGTNAARYGTMKENVINLTVVLADGTVIKTKRRPRKSAAGYNLTNLFIGSEGTLGIVTEATLKLYVKPKFENIAVVSFKDIAHAANTVAALVQTGIQPNAVELLDDNMMRFVNDSGETTSKYEELPTLMLKLGGTSKESAKLLTNDVKKICKDNLCKSFKFAESDEEKFELWNARKVALWSTIQYGKNHIDPNIQVWTTDVAVPISKFVESLTTTSEDIKKTGLNFSIVGHAGDGNYHALILFKSGDYELCKDLVQRMVDRALAQQGTCTGEHGVGYGKREYLVEELGEDAVSLMRNIKLALDPKKILNPDKIFQIDPNEEPDHSH